MLFYYQVSLPHYQDDKFLKNAVERYKQFVSLKKLHPSETLVPMYDIDLMWHTHQLCPEAYWKDTEVFLGKPLYHDLSNIERGAKSKRTLAENKTKVLWLREFGIGMIVPGVVYRGEPPIGRILPLNDEEYDTKSRHKLLVGIDTVQMKCKERFANSFEASLGLNSGPEVIFSDNFIGKSHQLSKGIYTWDKNSKKADMKEQLPMIVQAEPDRKYKMGLKVIRRGRLKGLLPRKEYIR